MPAEGVGRDEQLPVLCFAEAAACDPAVKMLIADTLANGAPDDPMRNAF